MIDLFILLVATLFSKNCLLQIFANFEVATGGATSLIGYTQESNVKSSPMYINYPIRHIEIKFKDPLHTKEKRYEEIFLHSSTCTHPIIFVQGNFG